MAAVTSTARPPAIVGGTVRRTPVTRGRGRPRPTLGTGRRTAGGPGQGGTAERTRSCATSHPVCSDRRPSAGPRRRGRGAHGRSRRLRGRDGAGRGTAARIAGDGRPVAVLGPEVVTDAVRGRGDRVQRVEERRIAEHLVPRPGGRKRAVVCRAQATSGRLSSSGQKEGGRQVKGVCLRLSRRGCEPHRVRRGTSTRHTRGTTGREAYEAWRTWSTAGDRREPQDRSGLRPPARPGHGCAWRAWACGWSPRSSPYGRWPSSSAPRRGTG